MTLPINITGVLWFAPTPVWEWENVPVVQPTANEAPDAASGDGTRCDTAAPATDASAAPLSARRLVFVGYSYDVRYNWLIADSPLSRPWLQTETDEDRRDRAPKPVLPVVPKVPPEHD
jgi:hypothetical protein